MFDRPDALTVCDAKETEIVLPRTIIAVAIMLLANTFSLRRRGAKKTLETSVKEPRGATRD